MRALRTFLFLLVLGSVTGDFQTAESNAFIYNPLQSSITFSLRHLSIETFSGEFKNVHGDFYFDPHKIEKTQVRFKIKSGSVETGNLKKNSLLQSKDFFWPEAYPEISFISRSIHLTGPDTFIVSGDLTLRGVTKTVQFKTKILEASSSTPFFEAAAKLNRMDFNLGTSKTAGLLNTLGQLVQEELSIHLKVRGAREN